jgi:hypothetical protein
MQTLSEAVAALKARRDQEEATRRAEIDRAAANKLQREMDFAAAFAAHLQAREGVDLTSPDAEARVEAEEFGNPPHYEVSVCLRGGRVEPHGSALLTTRALTDYAWENRGWLAHFNGQFTDSGTFLGACLAVYQNAPVEQDAELDAEADAVGASATVDV